MVTFYFIISWNYYGSILGPDGSESFLHVINNENIVSAGFSLDFGIGAGLSWAVTTHRATSRFAANKGGAQIRFGTMQPTITALLEQ